MKSAQIFGAVSLSLLLLIGSAPTVLLAHEGHDYGAHPRGGYEGDQEDSGRYDRSGDDDRWERDDDEGNEDESYRPSTRHYPPPHREHSAPREYRGRPY